MVKKVRRGILRQIFSKKYPSLSLWESQSGLGVDRRSKRTWVVEKSTSLTP